MLSARDLLVVLHFRILAFDPSWLRRVAIPRLLLEGGGLRLLFISRGIILPICLLGLIFRLVAGFRVVYAAIPTLFVVKAVSKIVKCKDDIDDAVYFSDE